MPGLYIVRIFSSSELVEPHIIPLKVRLAVALKEEAKWKVFVQGKNPEKNENEDAVNHLNDNNSSLQFKHLDKIIQIRPSQLIRNPVLSSRVIRC